MPPERKILRSHGRWLLRVGRRRLPERFHELLREVSFAPVIEVFADELGRGHYRSCFGSSCA